MTVGGRRVQVRRPRMRTADDERELSVQTYEQSSSATGKTAVSDMFVERTRTALQARRARSACDLTDKARSPIACKPGETHCQPARTDPRPSARRHPQALDRHRHARRRAAAPAHHRLPRLHPPSPPPSTPPASRSPSPSPSDRQPQAPPTKSHDDPDILLDEPAGESRLVPTATSVRERCWNSTIVNGWSGRATPRGCDTTRMALTRSALPG
jgi:hypothetical protein